MNIFYLTGVILLAFLLIIIILLIRLSSIKKDRDKYKDISIDEIKEVFKERWGKEEQDFKLKKTELQIEEKEINSTLAQLKLSLKEKEKRYEEINKDLDRYKSDRIKEIDGATAEYEQRKQLIVDKGIEEYRAFTSDFFNAELELQKEQIEQVKEQKENLLKDIETVKAELEVERSKRAAINEQIRKQRELEEQQDFYRIKIDPKDIDDIKILREIAPRLRHPDAINKVIWNGYYQKPLAELRKRLLPNGDVSCVYMATRIKTKEMYIGQTTSFDKRLQEHTRSALGIGTLASSMLHKKMYEDGPEQFLWQILEVVPKEKLRERESYYIDFYKSNKFGLNTLSGDKK